MDRRPEPEEVRAAWDTLAPYWDEQMQAGNTWQRNLIQPAVERLLGIAPGELVLEIACGNGLFARRMAELGARVLGTDFSEPMLNRARAYGGDVEYRLADAADETALLALGEAASFDAVVCNMAIMDMVEIEPMIAASSKLLRRDGRFVFSTVHPAFNGEATRVLEQTEDERGVVRTDSIKVSRYIRPSTQLGVALEGQPVVQWYFHRPLSALPDLVPARLRPRRNRGTRTRARRRAAWINVRCVHRSATNSRRADATGAALTLPARPSRAKPERSSGPGKRTRYLSAVAVAVGGATTLRGRGGDAAARAAASGTLARLVSPRHWRNCAHGERQGRQPRGRSGADQMEKGVAEHDAAAAHAYLSLKLIAAATEKGGGAPAQGEGDHAPGQRHPPGLRPHRGAA